MEQNNDKPHDDISKWVSTRLKEYKVLRKSYLASRDVYISDGEYDPDAAEHFKTLADISLGRILILEQLLDKIDNTHGE